MKILVGSALILFSLAFFYDPFTNTGIEQYQVLSNNTTFDEFLGVNSIREKDYDLINDQYQVAKFHRIFAMDSYLFSGAEFVVKRKGNNREVDLSIPHDQYPHDKFGFNPSKAAGFNFDNFLQEMKENGLNSIPVLAKNLLYHNVPENNNINVWQIPWDDGGNPENPMDYKAYASFLYQFTARYGKNKFITEGGTIDPRLLKLTPTNEPKAGLDLVFAIEPGNEMDKDWISEREEASPEVLAAFLSAVIDGHMGLMGEGHGILTADSTMKILFPSPIDIKADFVLEVLDIMKKLRSDAPKYGHAIIPEENLILTAHFYPFKRQILPGARTSDIVENTDLITKSLNFLEEVRARYDCPVYMTETGYDKVVKGDSDIGTPVSRTDKIDSHVISTSAQAKHIARLLLIMYGVGYDKTFLFTLKDPLAIGAPGYKTKYGTAGLTRKDGKKDPSWYVVNHMRQILTGFHLQYADFNDEVKLMKLHNNNDAVIFIYWIGTNNSNVALKKIPIEKKYSRGSVIELSAFSDELASQQITLNNEVEVEVTEFPRLLVLEP